MTRTARIPAVIEDALWEAARARLPAAVLGGAALTAAVIDRSRRYTTERDALRSPTRGTAAAADLAARALFFTVADAGKLSLVLDELDGARAPVGFLTGDRLAVLDVGAGCGAMILGLVSHLAARRWCGELVATLVDRDADALALAAAATATVAAVLGVRLTLTTRSADVIHGLPRGPFDLVLAGTVINELSAGLSLVAATVDALAARGVAVIIEPALRATSRELHSIRDTLVTRGDVAVLAPCTRRVAPCPALADDRDWCHEHRPAELPSRARQLATITGLRDGDAKFSFLALTRATDAPPPVEAWRVIDDPHAQKGKLELTACGAPGWVSVRLLRRHRSDANRPIERVRRGDLFTLARPADAGSLELAADDAVTSA